MFENDPLKDDIICVADESCDEYDYDIINNKLFKNPIYSPAIKIAFVVNEKRKLIKRLKNIPNPGITEKNLKFFHYNFDTSKPDDKDPLHMLETTIKIESKEIGEFEEFNLESIPFMFVQYANSVPLNIYKIDNQKILQKRNAVVTALTESCPMVRGDQYIETRLNGFEAIICDISDKWQIEDAVISTPFLLTIRKIRKERNEYFIEGAFNYTEGSAVKFNYDIDQGEYNWKVI